MRWSSAKAPTLPQSSLAQASRQLQEERKNIVSDFSPNSKQKKTLNKSILIRFKVIYDSRVDIDLFYNPFYAENRIKNLAS